MEHDMERRMEVLRGTFDIETHRNVFVNYLEVVILEDGKVVYANPSHQEKLIALACEKLCISRETLENSCPPQYYSDYMTWLSMVSGAIPVWNEMTLGPANEKQVNRLRILAERGLFLGEIPNPKYK